MAFDRPGETTGDLFAKSSLGHLELLVGSAVAYPFQEAWPDRIFNGAVIYALGEVEDGRYSGITAADRARGCPRPVEAAAATTAPTAGPGAGPEVGEVAASPATSAAPTTAATAAATAPADEGNGTSTTASDGAGDQAVATTMPTQEADNPRDTPGSTDGCPSSDANADGGKDVVVRYKYAMITDGTLDIPDVVGQMEGALHSALISGKCSSTTRRAQRRALQAVMYRGFRSDPADRVSSEGCEGNVTVTGGREVCTLVMGGVTVLVADDVDEGAVRDDIESYAETVFSDPATYRDLGVQQVAYDSFTFGAGAGDYGDDEDRAFISDNDANGVGVLSEEAGDGDPVLTTTGIIIIAVVGSVLLLVVLGLAAVRLRNKTKRRKTTSRGLFEEFTDEQEYDDGLSSVDGYLASFAPPPVAGASPHDTAAPASVSVRSSSGRPQPQPAVIVHEQDDLSLFSSDRSRHRFAPSSRGLAVHTPGGTTQGSGGLARTPSVDSRGSRGSSRSRSSKKSVEFVKAGQSFGSNVSYVPEDTVDL